MKLFYSFLFVATTGLLLSCSLPPFLRHHHRITFFSPLLPLLTVRTVLFILFSLDRNSLSAVAAGAVDVISMLSGWVSTPFLQSSYAIVFCAWADFLRKLNKRFSDRYKTHSILDVPETKHDRDRRMKDENKWKIIATRLSVACVSLFGTIAIVAAIIIFSVIRRPTTMKTVLHHCQMILHYLGFSMYAILGLLFLSYTVIFAIVTHKLSMRSEDRRFMLGTSLVLGFCGLLLLTKSIYMEVQEGLKSGGTNDPDDGVSWTILLYYGILELLPIVTMQFLFRTVHKKVMRA